MSGDGVREEEVRGDEEGVSGLVEQRDGGGGEGEWGGEEAVGKAEGGVGA